MNVFVFWAYLMCFSKKQTDELSIIAKFAP